MMLYYCKEISVDLYLQLSCLEIIYTEERVKEQTEKDQDKVVYINSHQQYKNEILYSYIEIEYHAYQFLYLLYIRTFSLKNNSRECVKIMQH